MKLFILKRAILLLQDNVCKLKKLKTWHIIHATIINIFILVAVKTLKWLDVTKNLTKIDFSKVFALKTLSTAEGLSYAAQ